MKDLTIVAKDGKGDAAKTGSVTIKSPETLAEAVEMYGEQALLTNAMANFVITVQGRLRAAVKRGDAPEAIQAALGDSKMGVSLPRSSADPTTKIKAEWDKIPADVKKKLLADLKAKMAA